MPERPGGIGCRAVLAQTCSRSKEGASLNRRLPEPSFAVRKGASRWAIASEARVHPMTIRLVGFRAIVLLGLAGCATSPISAPPSLADLIAKVDTAYGDLPSLASGIQFRRPRNLCPTRNLTSAGVHIQSQKARCLIRFAQYRASATPC